MTVGSSKTIPAFYAGQSIFLTGATGFLGKMLIEKILRSCPDVREIFLLIRTKKELTFNERLEKLLNLPLYDKLREENFSSFEKIVPISGDVSEKELGLSVADRQMLVERVTIIIHTAADVKFNNSLKYAICTNTRATRDICILAQSMKNLKALVYISTAFAHLNKTFIEEKLYPPIADWRKMIEIAEMLDEHTLNIFMVKYLHYVPNTYIFSKNLAENIIQEYSSFLPCAIVRPSVVSPSIDEPIPGWIDNLYGPMGIFVGGAKGILRVGYLNKTTGQDFVPVDIVTKAVLVVIWKLGLTTSTTGSSTFVLNCTSQRLNTYEQDIQMLFDVAKKDIPFEGIVWTPHTILTDSFVQFYILTILLQILPALLIDLVLKFFGRQPMLLQLLRRIYVANCAVGYFSFHNWKYSNVNGLTLMSLIPPENREEFSFEYANFCRRNYLKNSSTGIKQFILHEDVNLLQLDAVKARNKRVYLLVRIIKTIISIGVLWIIYRWIYFYTL
ncbi:PREDICTED: fatty acyl-CoA reductase 1-like [Trachymyrmex cornetzi]|uniref:fatty acyl-CoA reductase 1-like n=1 Tax=Trachymyrmex cornetzi TaxID=471704 RepID=UPI00084F5D56|nr:PREDICTED: fatty acyl-CoA reductase 1-like [Trachymyrmex cornetzi]